ncbi:hypothetical protein [Oscillatoria acuminata]|uniref:hypothetical protein n=1 Tax=Oscillatoria acuminata TaxID=118323 RepID=UPI0002E92E60|nr:hypothetical protein [Oscillatoria acuminata]
MLDCLLEITTHRNSDRHFPLHLSKAIAFSNLIPTKSDRINLIKATRSHYYRRPAIVSCSAFKLG